MKNTFVKFVVPVLFLGALLGPIAANADATINHRLGHQNARINQGLRNHTINRYQAHNLRAADHRIHASERRDRAHDNGHLTAGEQHRLRGRLNANSARIYNKKHNM